jgi:hypothetical protein
MKQINNFFIANTQTNILVKHLTCGNEFYQQPNNHLQGKGCSICSGVQKKTNEIFQKESDKIHNNQYLLLDEYKNNATKVLLRHITCGNEFYQLPTDHINNKCGCPNCNGKEKLTKEIIQERSNEIHNKKYLILGDYINIDTKILIKCLVCNNQFSQSPDKHVGSKQGCAKCSNREVLSKEEIQKRSNKKYNDEYIILSERDGNSKVEIKHKVCNNQFKQTINNHLRGRKCPFCYGTPLKTLKQVQEESNNIHNKLRFT